MPHFMAPLFIVYIQRLDRGMNLVLMVGDLPSQLMVPPSHSAHKCDVGGRVVLSVLFGSPHESLRTLGFYASVSGNLVFTIHYQFYLAR